MILTEIYATEWEVDAKLAIFGGITRDDLIDVVRRVVTARRDAVADDPLGTAGQFAHIFGTRSIRGALKRHGWETFRQENIEATRHPKTGRKMVYQNVDSAAEVGRSPRAISTKGAGSERFVDSSQLNLFPKHQETVRGMRRSAKSNLWYFCVSVDGSDVRAELSLPAPLKGGNFEGFYERIFILKFGEWGDLPIKDVPMDDVTNIEPLITRRT